MAAPTSNNEVTARRLSRLLVGADGNGGLWGKIKDVIGTKQSLSDCTTFCTATAGWFKVASTDFDLSGANNINAVFEVITRSNSHITYGKLYINVRANSASNLPGCTDFKYVEESADTYTDSFNLKLKTTGLGANISVELWANPGTYRAVNFSMNKNEDDIHSHKYPWQFFSGEATGAAPVEDASANIRVFDVNKHCTRNTAWLAYGTLPVERGGTGSTTAKAAQNALLGNMNLVTTDPADSTPIVMRYLTPTDSNGAVYVNTAGRLWNYMKGKMSSATGVDISGNAATATTATNYNTSSGTIKTALDSKVSSITKNGSSITPTSGVANIGYIPTTYGPTSGTVQAIIQELRVRPGGSMGSVQVSADSTITGITITAQWYNYIWIPHRTGQATDDNQNYGTLILTPLITTPVVYVVEGQSLNLDSPTYRCKQLAYSDHSHGNMYNNGTLQTTDVTIENGDKLVITDSSNSSRIARASLTFDGSSNGALLTKKGTWDYPLEAFLQWGGKHLSSTFGPLDAALINVLGTNRFAYGKPAGITVEYTRDGGTTWIDYGASDASKIQLVTTATTYTIGKADSTNKATAAANWANYKLRITFTNPAFGLYARVRKFAFLVSTSGSNGCKVTARTITRTNEEAGGSWSTFGSMTLGGWSGWNIFNPGTYTPWSGSASQKEQHSKIEFLFEATAESTGTNLNYVGLSIASIYGYGDSPMWNSPSNLASTGHLYSYDYEQNVTFPATVAATNFNGPITRTLATSGTIAETNLITVTGSTDAFKLTYACPEANKGLVKLYTIDDGNETISIGNYVSSTYKEAISVTNGSATVTGTLTGTASTAKAYDTSFTGTNSIKTALDGKQNTLTVMTDTEVSDLLGAMA